MRALAVYWLSRLPNPNQLGEGVTALPLGVPMKELFLKLSTGAADGAASSTAPTAILGKLYAIEYQPGTIATGATLTVICTGANGAAKPLLTKASAGTSNVWYYPRDLVNAVADGAELTGTSGGDRACPVLSGLVNAAIASGGNSKVGYIEIYYED